MKKADAVNEENIEITIARLLERDESQWKVLDEIKGSIRRIEDKLDEKLREPLPCGENNRRLNTLEKLISEDHEPRIKKVEAFRNNLTGKLAAWGVLVILAGQVITGLIISYLSGLVE